MKSKALRRVET